jgi:hypothetical protein
VHTHAIQAPKVGHVLKVFLVAGGGPSENCQSTRERKKRLAEKHPRFWFRITTARASPLRKFKFPNLDRIRLLFVVGSGKFKIRNSPLEDGEKGNLSKLIFGSGFSIIPAISSQGREEDEEEAGPYETFASPFRN